MIAIVFVNFFIQTLLLAKTSQGKESFRREGGSQLLTESSASLGLLPSSNVLYEYQYGRPEISAIHPGKTRRFHCSFSCNVQHLHKNPDSLSARTLKLRRSTYCSVLSPLPLRRMCTWAVFHYHSFPNLTLNLKESELC